MSIHPIIKGLMMVSTENTGGSLDVTGPEGTAQFRRVDPHGVVMLFGGQQLSMSKDGLVVVARYFAAAALILGEDIHA